MAAAAPARTPLARADRPGGPVAAPGGHVWAGPPPQVVKRPCPAPPATTPATVDVVARLRRAAAETDELHGPLLLGEHVLAPAAQTRTVARGSRRPPPGSRCAHPAAGQRLSTPTQSAAPDRPPPGRRCTRPTSRSVVDDAVQSHRTPNNQAPSNTGHGAGSQPNTAMNNNTPAWPHHNSPAPDPLTRHAAATAIRESTKTGATSSSR